MLFLDTTLLPYSPIETLLNPITSIWPWLVSKISSDGVLDSDQSDPLVLRPQQEREIKAI
ncbi:hypothetical protein BDV25DRAFT_149531 [Aspergillus avenaceus]|uniref:Uncharacterized protein n=1 Tax=Aspergillus avenaceus TaxID=36643 RepID=A0A5N6U4A1_ASPAV|nr:hypothetical protein BDV25DRAFT_149531 [Aspergillus avenaceus]